MKVKTTVYISVDSDGGWAAMGLSSVNPQTTNEIQKLIREWSLDEDLGFCKVYKVHIEIEPPSMAEVVALLADGDIEDLGMMP